MPKRRLELQNIDILDDTEFEELCLSCSASWASSTLTGARALRSRAAQLTEAGTSSLSMSASILMARST